MMSSLIEWARSAKGHLDHGALGDAHAEDFGKRLHHRAGYIVGEAPEGEAAGYQHEGYEQVDAVPEKQACSVGSCHGLLQNLNSWAQKYNKNSKSRTFLRSFYYLYTRKTVER